MSTVLQLSEALAEVVKRVGPSVVRIEGGRGLPSSGIAWTPELVITISRAIEREEGLEVGLPDGSTVEASLVGRDPSTDLALLRTKEPKLTPASFGDAARLEVGHLVLGVARPGKSARAALGIASALGGEFRTPQGGKLDRYVQLDIGRYPGFSGGAVADVQGNVLGLGTGGVVRGVALAITQPTLQRVVEALVAHGGISRGFLGVGVFPVRLPEATAHGGGQVSGALITSVQPGSAAESAGLTLGDVLLTLDGEPVTHPAELFALLDSDRVGKPVAVKVLRGGAPRELTVTVGSRPS